MSNFARDIERSMKQQVESAYRQRASEMQATFDRLGRELKGQPLAAAKSRLQREWARDGGSLTDPELTDYATALVEGTRIVLDVQPMRW
jgi:hypothetical protein